MTQVSFYLLGDNSEEKRAITSCRLAEKAYQQKLRIYLYVETPSAAQQLDELLWTFRDDSFLPHAMLPLAHPFPTPIQVGHEAPKEPFHVLINLTKHVPAFYQQFERVLEIIPNDDTWRNLGRQHYRFYQQNGCKLQSHQLTF